ncbi:AEC family transporter [Pseudooceanicola nanhaiensis]|uniref:AEC family transporter n=1 Tax=Pseudooceanicola nanhaiensis TaxID=375761 RepID=UPI001CD68C10|nr:AEC family transporter [Pseudooceanicola nanhaiensis]MCA0920650.1 AEC family transporter [Pseudooceanicola nanhaiensis]
METLFYVVLPVFLLIGAGYAATRSGGMSALAIDGLMTFAQKYALPCVLFSGVAKLDLAQAMHPALLASFYTGAFAAFVVGFLVAHFVFGRSWQDSVVIGFIAEFSNTMMLGLPVVERAYGQDELNAAYAVISIHAPVGYTLGTTVMEVVRARETGLSIARLPLQILRQLSKNMLVVALMVGFIVNIVNLPLPQPLWDGIALMNRAALPVALFAVGGILVRYKLEGDGRVIAMICFLSLVLHPAIALGMGVLLGLSPADLRGAVIMASVAPGINTYVFASIYGRALRVSASSVLVATATALLTVWFWLTVLP